MSRTVAAIVLALGALLVGGCEPAPRDCPRCVGLAADNTALRQDNERLRAELSGARAVPVALAAPQTAPPVAPTPNIGAFVPPAPRATTPPPAPSERLSASVQCSGITQKGARCKRMTKSANGRCYQHGGS